MTRARAALGVHVHRGPHSYGATVASNLAPDLFGFFPASLWSEVENGSHISKQHATQRARPLQRTCPIEADKFALAITGWVKPPPSVSGGE